MASQNFFSASSLSYPSDFISVLSRCKEEGVVVEFWYGFNQGSTGRVVFVSSDYFVLRNSADQVFYVLISKLVGFEIQNSPVRYSSKVLKKTAGVL